jgi:hypothetical protein
MRKPVRTPVIVETPYPTVWQTAKKMGVSRKRTLEIIKIVDEIHARREQKRKEEEALTRIELKTV